jgi:tellurite resistance protein TerC
MTLVVWAGFIGVILLLLAVDLLLLHRRAHIIGVREALITALCWVGVSLAFNIAVYFLYQHQVFGLGRPPDVAVGTALDLLPADGRQAALMFFNGYLVELMFSLDNMLVIALILAYFRIPAEVQHRVLFWGIIGVIVLRGAMIVVTSFLLNTWGHWMLLAFGVLLVVSAAKMLVMREEEAEMERKLIVRSARRLIGVSPHFDGEKFFTRINGKLLMTPLMVALLVVDVADLALAVQSIPAVFGITTDPFLVFASNCFAVLGLRSIYFAMAAVTRRFRFLKISTVFVLAFIGGRMIADRWYQVSPEVSLLVIASILAFGVVASLAVEARDRGPQERPIDDLTTAAEEAWRKSRKVIILIVGLTIVFIIAPLVGALPGPGGIFVALGGLALLATEFVWARRLLTKMKEKAMLVSGTAPSSSPPRLWLIPVVIGCFALFVLGLVLAEREFADQLPKWARNVFLLALGPGIAVGYWAIMTYRRWRQFRSTKQAGSPGRGVSSPASIEGLDRQRQRSGSA